MNSEFQIERATLGRLDAAFLIVEEYYDAANVVARDTKHEFQHYYFGERSGVWLASTENNVVGCIALRDLSGIAGSGEIKRLYVRPIHRGRGVAQKLLDAVEKFAANAGYGLLYLDSAPGMDVAIRFYRQNGFQPCPPYNDNPQANVFLRKKIR